MAEYIVIPKEQMQKFGETIVYSDIERIELLLSNENEYYVSRITAEMMVEGEIKTVFLSNAVYPDNETLLKGRINYTITELAKIQYAVELAKKYSDAVALQESGAAVELPEAKIDT